MPMVTINGRELHFARQGSGPLAVLIHGYPLDHTMWLDQLSGLSGVRTTVALDLPGYGMSERVTGQPLTMHQLADDVAGLIRELGESSADVVGLSMGGYVALALWERHQDVVRTLVLANTRAAAESEEGRAGREAQAVAAVGDREPRCAAGCRPQHPRWFAARPVFDNTLRRYGLEGVAVCLCLQRVYVVALFG